MIKKLIVFLVILYGCNRSEPDALQLKKELIKTDQDFSQLSLEKGMKEAFLFYAADSVIMLRQGEFPLMGKISLIQHLKSVPHNQVHLMWTPTKAEVSGDLGYTFGNWKLKITGKDTVEYGNYVTIWKKFSDGRWKYILDGGNDTPKQEW